jgi:kynureninase
MLLNPIKMKTKTEIKFEFTEAFAKEADATDELRTFREMFYIPKKNHREVIYFTGNSLGLEPVRAQEYILQELDDWKELGVEGHVKARRPWMPYHEFLTPYMAEIAGALPTEVVMMNQLTVNLHLLLVSFYRPDGKKYKILTEGKSFPSDRYALCSQIRFHGYDPADALLEIFPDEGEDYVRTEKILKTLEENAGSIALVMMSGVNYYNGQVFDMEQITRKAHQYGIPAGFDLAHAAGNIPLKLHDWEVDFACWCSYKYLNSGPGSVAGVFIHEKHHRNFDLPLFAGWWGTNKTTRFSMLPDFDPIPTAERWQLSNAPVFSMAACLASLEIFHQAGMDKLHKKSKKLTGFLDFILHTLKNKYDVSWKILTPQDARGCQISLYVGEEGKAMFNYLEEHGVIADWREPGVIRMAPVPLYNSFTDVYRFGKICEEYLRSNFR